VTGIGTWEVFDSITQVDRAEWNSLVRRSGGSAFHTYEWLLAYEQAPPEPLHAVRHLALRRAGEMVLAAPMYEVSEDPHLVGYGPEYGFDHELLHARMLVAHSWYAYYNGVCSPLPPEAYVDELTERMHAVALDLGTPVYGFPGVALHNPLGDALRRRGFAAALTEATSVLPIRGRFDDYLLTLAGKTRTEFRRRAKRYRDRNATLRTGVRAGDAAAMAGLIEKVCARHGSTPVNPPDNVAAMFANLGDALVFNSLWRGEIILGGNVMLRHGDALFAWLMGLDHDTLREYAAYDALKWEQLRLAHELGVARVEVGRGMYEMKVRLGMDPCPLVTWLRAASPEGENLVRSGVPALTAGSATRARVLDAYAMARREPPDVWSSPPLLAIAGG
jgi:hypothetical protein